MKKIIEDTISYLIFGEHDNSKKPAGRYAGIDIEEKEEILEEHKEDGDKHTDTMKIHGLTIVAISKHKIKFASNVERKRQFRDAYDEYCEYCEWSDKEHHITKRSYNR